IFSHYLFIACSVTFGYIASYLYTYILFTEVPLTDLIVSFLFYLLWVLFIVSFTTMMSTIFNSQVVIALLSIVFLLYCQVIVCLYHILDHLHTARICPYAMEIVISATWSVNVILNIIISLILSTLAINVSNIWITGKKYRVN